MDKLFNVKILGYRWVSSRPHQACKRCAAMHGLEFYFKPQPGQLSVDQMPEPPLHPNCRCTTMRITKAKVLTNVASEIPPLLAEGRTPEDFHGNEDLFTNLKPYMQAVATPDAAFIWRDKTEFLAPIYGKYCGDGWNAGMDVGDKISKPVSDRTPEDSLDAACKAHDKCYDRRNPLPCDSELIDRLRSLDPDPRKWPNPPASKGELEYAKRYRSLAIFIFELKRAYEYISNMI